MINIDNIALAVFDLDDTLYPEKSYVIGGLKNVAAMLSPGDRDAADALYETMLTLHNQGHRDIFQRILTDFGAEPSVGRINEMLTCYRLSDRPMNLFSDADGALERFCQAGVHSAILTDGYLSAQQKKVELLKLEERVEKIVYTDFFGRDYWKPSPHCFELLMNEYHLSPGQCVYIGDNEAKDFAGPNRLGWQSVKIVRQDGVYKNAVAEEPVFKAKYTLTTLDELEIRFQ
jgi:putative hydrolase of the HAD superfamily